MKSLFAEDASYTQETLAVESAVLVAIRDVFDNWTGKGYSPRDISKVISGVVIDIECDTMLRLRAQK